MSAPQLARRFLRRLRGGGVSWLFGAIAYRIAPARPAMLPTVVTATASRVGLEIGGPSRIFGARGSLPIYPHATRIDNVNFATQTAWEQGLHDGGPFRYDSRHAPGTQRLREAVALTGVADATYDFILSSHCLEHVADPLRALGEWHRVTRPGGHLLLVLPDPERTFDHRRPVTTLAHLRDDRAHQRSEDDMTHAAEALALHDLTRDPGAGSAGEFQARVRHNLQNRCLHHHVFDHALMSAALVDTGWQVLATAKVRPLHLVGFARKEDA